MMYFVCLSVTVADLLSHSELDPDSDGSFTEAEAQVKHFFLCFFPPIKHCCQHQSYGAEQIEMFLVQGLLGGVDKVDTAAFESVWNNIKEKYVSEVWARLFF